MDSLTLDVFFKLLISSLYGTKLQSTELPDSIDWKAIMDLATKQTVYALIADAVSRLPKDKLPDEKVLESMQKRTMRIVQAYRLMNTTLADVVSLYQRHGIEPVLLKGQGIAQHYDNPVLRQCGDIDLYVGQENYHRSCEIARKELQSDNDNTTESEKHYHCHYGTVAIELHRIAALMNTPWRSVKFNRWIDSELKDPARHRILPVAGVDVHLPSYDFDAIFIFYHAWHHLMSVGVGLRQICDWTILLHKHAKDIDRQALERNLKRFGLVRPWQIMGYIAVNSLGLPVDEMPLYTPKVKDRSDEILDEILYGGNFGFFSGRRIERIDNEKLAHRKLRTLIHVSKNYLHTVKLNPTEATFHLLATMLRKGFKSVGQIIKNEDD